MNELKTGIKSFYTSREKALKIKVRNRTAQAAPIEEKDEEESRNPFTSPRHIS